MKEQISLYDDFFNTKESQQYKDLKSAIDSDFQKNVIFEGYDFPRESWFRSIVATALSHYYNDIFNSNI